MSVRVGVVARGNEVAAARVLAPLLRAVHPDWKLTVLLLPGIRPEVRADDEPFEVLTAAGLGGSELGERLAVAPPAPAEVLMRAMLARHLLTSADGPVLLLPPDAEVHGPLDALVRGLDGASAVLVPRLTGRLPDDGMRPDGQDLLEAGEIDDELVAVAPTEGGRAFVSWWVERGHEAVEDALRLRTNPGVPLPVARLGASPLAAARKVFGDLALLEDPSIDVSFWNLHERELGAEPPALIRFRGFRADRPWWLSSHATRTIVLDDPVLSRLTAQRSRALLDAGWVTAAELAELSHDQLPGGLRFDERLRRLYAEALDTGENFGDVMSPSGADAFESWLREPGPHGGRAGINRYCHDVWRHRPDVQEAYADLDGADAEGFVGWLWVHGRPELKLQPPLLPPAPEWAQDLDRRVPSVLVTGYLRGNLGLGEAARSYVAALQAAEVPVATRSVATDPPVERLPRGAKQRPEEREFEDLALGEGVDAEVHLLCVNADQLPEFVGELGEQTLAQSYVIGNWAWETDAIPERWDTAFDLVDEVWTYSTYVAENIARAGDVPVVVVPMPVKRPDPAGAKVPFEIPDAFTFLFAFDFFSTIARKNPDGLIEAFRLAFEPGEGPVLLLKTINADFRPQDRERLRHAIADRPDILLVDRTLTPPEMAALFARADCYVSLHRAEGFGITLAESMLLGKPVIATGFSGNTDFMSASNSYLVDWVPTEVGPEAEHYPEEGTWAEPSVEHAAALMREVWEDQEAARARGARASSDIAAALSAEAVGAIARARLERIAARRRGATGSGAPPYPLDEVVQRLGATTTPSVGGARGVLQRLALRITRPYAMRQRSLDEAIATSLQKLQLELDAERAARARERARLARIERRLK